MAKIIDLHRVVDGKLLEKLLLYLKRTTTMVSIEELENAHREGRDLRRLCHITIDDGDLSSYRVVYPLLKKLKIPATLFISPGICLEGKNYWFQEIEGYQGDQLHREACGILGMDPGLLAPFPVLVLLKALKIDQINKVIEKYLDENHLKKKEPLNIDADQILEMDRSGWVTFGAHTMNHPILSNEEPERSRWEITQSVRSLESLLDHAVSYFAYPNGLPELDYGSREVEYLRDAGCRMAFSNHLDRFTREDDSLKIPRYALDVPFFRGALGNGSITKLKLLLGPGWDHIKNLCSPDEGMKRFDLKKRIRENQPTT